MNDGEFYSNQPWYVKFWRNKTLLFVPYNAFIIWVKNVDRTYEFSDVESTILKRLTFAQSWSIARVLADVRRKHLHRWDDVKKDETGMW